jgi:uncharacterized membrane protein
MIAFLSKSQNRMMIALVMACFMFSAFRLFFSGTSHYLFLVWNLFLAGIPFLLVQIPAFERSRNSLILVVISGFWLLFFPNAPYILTDLFHLKSNSSMPIWFDLIVIMLYAWTGLLAGFYSLYRIEKKYVELFGLRFQQLFTLVLLFLSSFGIYLGRYLRFKSWDLFQKPSWLMGEVADRFIHPMDHPRTWGFTLFMGMMLSLFYFSLKWVGRSIATSVRIHQD